MSDYDFTEVDRLASQMASLNIVPAVRQVVSKGSLQIKNQIQRDFAGSRHFRSVREISYDLSTSGDVVESVIGPHVENEGFGSLVGIAIYGGSRGGGGTVPDPLIALRAEEPALLEAMGDVVEKVLDE
ncbi:hypothetical protein LJ753_10890 [Arthrobacter sp. zg-Y20]|uniref:hypothetical protein n=1 Tax=unclassified Arthrobacter TaxID=235627 RepID=UPI001D144185|nr:MULTISPECIES: hypothetical protein [unclassified Arthrobacter]MCC3276376.1 hypothetical protein [Arthrobacter sp. zg-Y20]MDK1316535.1 hypothetical protein [Arthrobacter sp. zg.Y20]WIB06576.1 hypothetical protein QNO06_02190 [Arthrobacter sp. zg-Y20]